MAQIKGPKIDTKMAVPAAGVIAGMMAYNAIQVQVRKIAGERPIGDWDREIASGLVMLSGGLVAANSKGRVRAGATMFSVVGLSQLTVALLKRWGIIPQEWRIFMSVPPHVAAQSGNGNGAPSGGNGLPQTPPPGGSGPSVPNLPGGPGSTNPPPLLPI
jgi:hypothetical protein